MAITALILLLCSAAIAATTIVGLRATRRAPRPRALPSPAHTSPQLPYTPEPPPPRQDPREELLAKLPAAPTPLVGAWQAANSGLPVEERRRALTKLSKLEPPEAQPALLARVVLEATKDHEEPLREACLGALYQHYKDTPPAQSVFYYLSVRHHKSIWRIKCLEAISNRSKDTFISLALQPDAPIKYRKKLLREMIPMASAEQLAPHMQEILRAAPQELAQRALQTIMLSPIAPVGAEYALLALVRAPKPQQSWAATYAMRYLAARQVTEALPIARRYMEQRQHQLGALRVLECMGTPADLAMLDEMARRRLLMDRAPPALREAATRAAEAIRARVNREVVGGLSLAEGSDSAGGLEVVGAEAGGLSSVE